MAKNLVVCCDGTGMEFGYTNTNVVKLFRVLCHDPAKQVVYYHPGLGTMPAPGALTHAAQLVTKAMGLAFGYGLTPHIGSAYEFLMENHEPGDRVYLFGFSRGAYTVRSVAAALHMFGLMQRQQDALVPYLTRMFREKGNRIFELARQFRETFSTQCGPDFVGLWDTVSLVGWIYDPVRLPYTFDNPDISVARHAVAIDERRCFYRQNLMKSRDDHRDIVQVWFPGVHCDVGGGYDEKESGLSNITLHWMLKEAESHGLLIDQARRARLGAPSADAKIHTSLEGAWWALEYLPRPVVSMSSGQPHTIWCLGRGRPRKIPENAKLHVSVKQRMEASGSNYRPALPSKYEFVE